MTTGLRPPFRPRAAAASVAAFLDKIEFELTQCAEQMKDEAPAGRRGVDRLRAGHCPEFLRILDAGEAHEVGSCVLIYAPGVVVGDVGEPLDLGHVGELVELGGGQKSRSTGRRDFGWELVRHHHALTNAERSAAYRERRKAAAKPVVVKYRKRAARRSRPRQWDDAVTTLLGILAGYRTGPTTCRGWRTPP